MPDGPEVIPLMRGGPLKKAGGCLVLLAATVLELGLGLVVGGGAWQAAGSYGLVPATGATVAAYALTGVCVMAAMAIFDRLAKALLGVSPFRALWELLVAIPNVP